MTFSFALVGEYYWNSKFMSLIVSNSLNKTSYLDCFGSKSSLNFWNALLQKYINLFKNSFYSQPVISKFFYLCLTQHFNASWIDIPKILCICRTCRFGPQWMNLGLRSIIHFLSNSINWSEFIFTNLYFQTLKNG